LVAINSNRWLEKVQHRMRLIYLYSLSFSLA
jgi:hypothetical protein